jgi:hypothetical protein
LGARTLAPLLALGGGGRLVRDVLGFSAFLGGMPAVLLVVVFGPPAPAGPGFLVWLAALGGIGWAATGLLYNVLLLFRRR